MAKTENELLKMGFMQLKKHCKALEIPIDFGATKSSMIKLILAKDPPPKPQNSDSDGASSNKLEHRLQKQLSVHPTKDGLLSYDETAYKDNSIASLDEALAIMKTFSPRSATGFTMYPAFRSLFRSPRFEQLSVAQFMDAVITGNVDVVSGTILDDLIMHIAVWDDPTHPNALNIALQRLDGFHAPPDSAHSDRLMFAMFQIDNLLPKIKIVQKLHSLRIQLVDALVVMTKLQSVLAQVVGNEVYSRILLSAILLSKFRNEDITVPLHAIAELNDQKNVIFFMQSIALQPTAKELFQSRRWDKLKEKGTLVQEINRPQLLFGDNEFNQIRAKAIKFGSAVAPQPARMALAIPDKKAKQQQIKKDIGAIDTKALQSKLAMALKSKLGAPAPAESNQNDDNDEDAKNENAENYENGNDAVEDEEKTVAAPQDDLSKFRKMLTMGVKRDAVVHAMQVAGVAPDVVQEFVNGVSNQKNDTDSSVSRPAVQRALPNALLADINNTARNNAAPAPAPPPAPAPVPAHAPAHVPAPPVLNTAAAHRINNASSSSPMQLCQHENAGLNWNTLWQQITRVKVQIPPLRILIHAADIRLFRRQQEQEQKQGDNDSQGQNDDNDDDVDDRKVDVTSNQFHDPVFEVYIAQLNRLQSGVNEAVRRNSECEALLKQLDQDYHSKYRPMILGNVEKSNYGAVKEAANGYGDGVFVPDDIIGTIWSFVKPFDELVELKFAVDCINEYFDKEKKKIAVKKLPIQSHRGFEHNL